MRYRPAFILFVGFFSTFCRGENETPAQALLNALPSEDRLMRTFVEGNNRMGFEFYQQVKGNTENVLFSPYSLSAGLGLAAAGAKGETAREFQHLLGYSLNLLPLNGDVNAQFSNPSKTGSQVILANALWVQKDFPLLPSFKLTIEKGLGAYVQPVDFALELPQSVLAINKWVAEHTKGKINSLLNPQDVTRQTRLVLTAALYLKGAWAQPFDPRQSKRLPFKISSRSNLTTNMMRMTASFLLLKGDKWDLLEIPYQKSDAGGELALTLLLPKEGVIEELEKNFTWDNWQQWLTQMQMQSVALTLPVFRMDKRMDLNAPLKALGLSSSFSQEADFSGMTGQKDLFLHKAVQKMFIMVDEKGTEAAATTAVSVDVKSVVAAEPPYEFNADHPFLFVLWDKKSGSILFMGRLTTP